MSRAAAGIPLAAVVAAALLASCGGDGGPERAARWSEGGTLRFDTAATSYHIDPATAFVQSPLLEATQLTLVAYPNGPAPPRPVPEAAELPRVSDDGLTYTFAIRRGFRFSDGRPVTAADFAYTLNRVLRPELRAYAAGWLADVVGADDVAAGRTDDAAGIVADGSTLTLTLRRPVGDLLAKLALPNFGVVPVGFPIVRGGVVRAPLHSAGPYYVAEYEAGRRAVLRRNPFWRRFLVPRRPAHVDRIVVAFDVPQPEAVARVQRNVSDLARTQESSLVRDLAARYGRERGRLFQRPRLETVWLAFNQHRPLFADNVRLRRAVNFALDRPRLVPGWATELATPTDQLIPPGGPAFRDHSIYPVDGRLLTRARELAAGARRGGRAILWAARGDDEELAERIASDLRGIGLEVELETFSIEVIGMRSGQRDAQWDMIVTQWFADYPDGANIVVDGLSRIPGALDDPRLAGMLSSASSLEGAARADAFAALDLEIMRDYAPIAPIYALEQATFVSSSVGCVEFGWHGVAKWDAICRT